MMSMKNRRIWNAYWYGWKDAGEIAKLPEVNMSRFAIFRDILHCFKEYYLFGFNYKNNKIWAMSEEQRQELANTLGKTNKRKDVWVDTYYKNWKFLNKYTDFRWQKTLKRMNRRKKAYINHYGLGEGLSIQYGVTLIAEHFNVGEIKCGKRVLLARNVDIDYTGGITFGNGVELAEGVKVLTHNHDFFGMVDDGLIVHEAVRAYLTPLVIEDNVFIGAHSVIMPGVNRIGKNAMIAPGSVVMEEVPPNTIFSGNPAKKVGKLPRVYFRYKE